MSILEIVLMVLMGLGVGIWATVIIVKHVKKKKNPKKDEEEEIDL